MSQEAPLNPSLYSYPDVGHFGLTHSLMAWARCLLWSKDNKAQILAPNWFRIRGRIGPLMRRERDKRQYQMLFKFEGYVTGLRRLYLLRALPQIDADAIGQLPPRKLVGPCLVVFKNLTSRNTETYFHQIQGRSVEVRSALLQMTKPRYRPLGLSEKHIAVHVRMGDFAHANSPDTLRDGQRNTRIPIGWYVEMLRGLRDVIGRSPTILYSDGSNEDLRDLLSIDGVVRSASASAVTDLLSMADAQVLLSSGSGYSQWGSYLGEVPRICFPGQRFVRVLGEPSDIDLEPEADSSDDLPAAFVLKLRQLFAPK